MTQRTYKLTFDGITLDTSKLRMEKRGGKEVIDYFFLNADYRIEDDTITDVASFRKAIEEGGDECRILETDGDRTVVEVTLDLEPIHKPDPPTLECMSSHLDGAHCGLGDWYPEIEEGIQAALNQGPEHEWTTGWYASKKEIASARITNADGGMKIEVSVSDDFDTPGLGERVIEHTTDLETIRAAIYEAWDDAEGDQKDNRLYVAYSVLTEVEHTVSRWYIPGLPYWLGSLILRVLPFLRNRKVRSQGWVETYLKPTYEACDFGYDQPPGDNYHQWGFQDEYDIPEDVKEQLEEWAQSHDLGSFTVGEFTIKSWDDPKHLND